MFGSFLILSDGNVWVYIVGARKYIMGGIPGKSGEGAFPQGDVCCGWGTTAYRGIVWEMCAVAGAPRPIGELCGKRVLWLAIGELCGKCVLWLGHHGL